MNIQQIQQPVAVNDKRLRLYVYGSCQSDQYYHPRGDSQSKRPICLTDIEGFNLEDNGQDEASDAKIIPNPIFKADIYKIACGALHTVVLTTDGVVFSFGCNDEGALGRQGSQRLPVEVKINEPIHLISAGDNHSVFANSLSGNVYFTGSYKYMRGESMAEKIKIPIQSNVADYDYKLRHKEIQKLVSGNNHSAILVGGKIFIRGEPETHTVGRRISQRHKVENSLTFDGVGLSHVEDLWCGGYHSFAKVKKHNKWEYYAWGLNKHGQLGLKNYDEILYPQQIKKFAGKNIVEVAAGTNFTVVLTEEGELFGCGQNDDGQLGLGQGFTYINSEQEAQEEEKNEIEEKKEEQQIKENDQNKIANKEVFEKVQVKDEVRVEEVRVEQKIEENVQQTQKKAQQPVIIMKEQKQQVVVPIEPQQVNFMPSEPIQIPQQVAFKPFRMREEDIYVKGFKKISIESQEKIVRVNAGSECCFGWNNDSLYSWGFGSNFVLLNGTEEDELSPFKVKPRILNQHTIWDVAAGAQHVVYLSYPEDQDKPEPKLSSKALEIIQKARKPLGKRKRRS